MKWYLAGPMSGIPEQNYPAFREASNTLRYNHGLDVVSPHETFPHPMQPDEERWAECLRKDVATLMHCQGIILLPGWSKSRGARLEMSLALQFGFPVRFYSMGVLHDFS